MIKTDVLLMTYNSAKYLDECLECIKKTVPVNRIIAVDHYSTDGTIQILEKYGAEIHQENVGLGYARQLSIDLAETETVTFIDSDIVFHSPKWWYKAYNLLHSDPKIGAVVARVSEAKMETPRMKYAHFWWKILPSLKAFGLTCGSTLMKLCHLQKFRIPKFLDCREDRFIAINLLRQGLSFRYTHEEGVHYFDYQKDKGYWAGAGVRLIAFYETDWKEKNIFYLLFRRILTAMLKAIPPALYYKDINIILWNTRHWLNFLKGWIQPYKHRTMRRTPNEAFKPG